MNKPVFPVGTTVVTRFGVGVITSWAENMKGAAFYAVQINLKKVVSVEQTELLNNNQIP